MAAGMKRNGLPKQITAITKRTVELLKSTKDWNILRLWPEPKRWDSSFICKLINKLRRTQYSSNTGKGAYPNRSSDYTLEAMLQRIPEAKELRYDEVLFH